MSGTAPPPSAPAAPLPIPASPLDKPTLPLPAPTSASESPATTATTEGGEIQKGQAKWSSKQNSEYFDPCQEAANRSWKCLRRNPEDKEICSDYFQAYRDCKKRWTEIRKEEKRKASAWTWY